MPSVLGFEGYLYVNEGTRGVPSYTEVGCLRDNTLNLEGAAVDVTCRQMRGQRAQVVGLQDIGADMTVIVQKPADVIVNTLRQAWFNRTRLDFLIYNGSIADANAEGIYGTFVIQNFTRGENIEDAMTYDITLLQPDVPETERAEWLSGASPVPS